jgi:2-polyprenyl-6-methoxyphenol hydroxylase-like FAD-dependent oxidoreductase
VATNALVRLYTDNGAAARLARSGILRLGERMTPIKNLMLRRLMEVDAKPALT